MEKIRTREKNPAEIEKEFEIHQHICSDPTAVKHFEIIRALFLFPLSLPCLHD